MLLWQTIKYYLMKYWIQQFNKSTIGPSISSLDLDSDDLMSWLCLTELVLSDFLFLITLGTHQ